MAHRHDTLRGRYERQREKSERKREGKKKQEEGEGGEPGASGNKNENPLMQHTTARTHAHNSIHNSRIHADTENKEGEGGRADRKLKKTDQRKKKKKRGVESESETRAREKR